MSRPSLHRLTRDTRGATIIEFAFIAPVLCMVVLAIGDFGYRAYLEAQLQGTLHEAARLATVGDRTGEEIDNFVRARVQLIAPNGALEIDKESYEEFNRVRRPEKVINDTAPVGEYNDGDCFIDTNLNGAYDTTAGRNGLGGAEDVVNYEVSVRIARMLPFHKFYGIEDRGVGDYEVISASTVLRNQPFAGRTSAPTVCLEPRP